MALGDPIIEAVDLTFPALPGALEGLRIAHISDLHIHRVSRRFDRLAEIFAGVSCDLALFTGDYMTHSYHEDAAVEVMAKLIEAVRPRLGRYGIFGNHDSPEIKPLLEGMAIEWLNNDSVCLDALPLDLLGVDTTEHRVSDPLRSLVRVIESENGDGSCTLGEGAEPGRLRIMLSHIPNLLPVGSDMGVDLMLSGHTHGGQMRLPWVGPIYNSTDIPLAFTSGILRYRDTLCGLTRGLGEVHLTFRILCPRQLPVYTLRKGPLPGETSQVLQCVDRW